MESLAEYPSELYGQINVLLQDIWNISDSNASSIFEMLNRHANGIRGMQLYSTILKYILPVIFAIGMTGNVLNLIVLRGKEMNSQSTSLFLTALAISDTLILLFGLLPTWLTIVFQIDIFTQWDALCKSLSHILYSSSHISAWLIVIVTINRYIIICKPFLTRELCTRTKAKKSIIGVLTLCLIINIHLYWTVSLDDDHDTASHKCRGDKQYKYFTTNILPMLDAGVYSVIPCCLLLIFNALIIRKIISSNKINKMSANKQRNNRKQTRFTKILITVSMSFVINAVPISILLIFVEHFNSGNYKSHALVSAWIARASAELLMYLNHSTSFILYSISGSKFRTAFHVMFCKRN